MKSQETILEKHAALRERYEAANQYVKPEEIKTFVAEIQRAREATEETAWRRQLINLKHYWEDRIIESPQKPRPRIPLWGLIVGGALALILTAFGVSRILVQDLNDNRTELMATSPEEAVIPPTATPLSTRALPTPTPTGAVATVDPAAPPVTAAEAITAGTPLTSTAPSTVTLPAPTATPSESRPTDPAADVAPLTGGATVADPPTGLDLSGCNISTNTLVLAALTPPAGVLTGTEMTADTLTVWLTFREPVPANRTLNYHWLMALDVDNNAATGRPAGDGYINPELGTEVGAGVFLYPNGTLEPYIYIWNPVSGDWDGDTPDIVSAELSEERDAIAFIFPLEELRAALLQIADVEYDPATLHGRVGAIASSQNAPAVVDFCPDLP